MPTTIQLLAECFRGCSLLRQVAVSLVAVLGCPAVAVAAVDDLIGQAASYVTSDSDTLLDVARRYDIGYVELLIANPGIDPWLPGAHALITLPTQHLLPNTPRSGIVLNLPELRLYYFPPKGGDPISFPVGIGDEGKDTPTGSTVIERKRAHPSWIPTASERAENPDLPAVVGPGPDNPMGDYALYLAWRGFAIHGTNKPYSIGRRGSHGCIRMYPEDSATLFRLVAPGTPVTIINQPVKTGWHEGQLYLEVHPELEDINAIEAGDRPKLAPYLRADRDILQAAGPSDAEHIDWDTVFAAELERDGMPVPIQRRQ